MANLERYTQKIFANDATSGCGQFGSGIANTKVTSDNVETLQALDAYESGWSSAIITNKNYPSWQERNGLDYGFSYQLAYIFQNGIPEYDDGTEYKTSSIVRKTGTYELYGSLTDENIGNALSDTTHWTLLGNLNSLEGYNPTGAIVYYSKNVVPTGYLICDGSAISRTTYARLYSVIGTTFGSGDGSTTFNLPNLIDKFPQGNTTVGTVKSAGLPNIKGYFCYGGATFGEYGGAFYYYSASSSQGAYDTYGNAGRAGFSANKSNSIYSDNVNTVQPPALTLLPCIKY